MLVIYSDFHLLTDHNEEGENATNVTLAMPLHSNHKSPILCLFMVLVPVPNVSCFMALVSCLMTQTHAHKQLVTLMKIASALRHNIRHNARNFSIHNFHQQKGLTNIKTMNYIIVLPHRIFARSIFLVLCNNCWYCKFVVEKGVTLLGDSSLRLEVKFSFFF